MCPKVKEIRIFSEEVPTITEKDDDTVVRCWKRGTSMKSAEQYVM